MNKKLMYIFAIFIVAAITCISQPKKTTLRDKAMVNYAFDYLSSPGSLPFTTAATELSAIHGHSTSQYRLGEFYLHGSDGKPLDYTQARYWYEQSAEQENPRAQSKLGWIYLKGLGVKPDTRKAILWYKEAAEQGYAHAQYTLGLIYRNGSGINVNHYESQKWLKLAAKQHYKNAERLLAGLPAHQRRLSTEQMEYFPYQTSKDKNIENNFNDAQTAWPTIVNGHWLRLRLRFNSLLLGKIRRLN